MNVKLILGDQLNSNHSWYQKVEHSTVFVIMELRQETDYAHHHIQKVIAFFGAMRAFNSTLKAKGHQTHYLTLDDPHNTQNLVTNLKGLLKHYKATQFSYQQPDVYRLDQQLIQFCATLELPTQVVDTEHFLTSRTELTSFFEGKKQLVMEYFYRMMRKKYKLLMRGDQPEGGQWNFDKNNR